MKASSAACVLGDAAVVAGVLTLGPHFALPGLSVASVRLLDEAPRSTASAVHTHFG